jgi:signal transduction histidine kinase
MNAVSELSSTISHDFNNMLDVILGYTELIKNEILYNANLQNYSSFLINSIQKAKSITSKLLTTTRQDSYNKDNIDLNPIISNFKHFLNTIVGNKIKIIYDLEENCIVYADPSQIESILLNLVINSRDALNGSGLITISVSKSDTTIYDLTEYVLIKFKDNGSGIDNKDLPFIFNLFL